MDKQKGNEFLCTQYTVSVRGKRLSKDRLAG
jgi:hypothetical protein